ncbi:MAG: hypothetical protein Q8O67_08850 [Deltaproteobacteria bacterium]|nr:hypothetical protein [Deltaproteobacteria bacterium]
MAKRLLALEAGAGTAETTAAARVFDKLRLHLSPLLGDAGVQLLFVRSAKLVDGEFAGLVNVSVFERFARLRATLEGDDAVALGSAELLFATFFALITSFIGDRLTTEVLRAAWPTLSATTPPESP